MRQKPIDVALRPVWILASAIDAQAFAEHWPVALETARLETTARPTLPLPSLHLDPLLLNRLHAYVVQELRRTRVVVVVAAGEAEVAPGFRIHDHG